MHTAEALLLARYFMYTQVYFHDVRRVYDLHLKDFLQSLLPNGKFSANWQDLMAVTDHEVLSAMREAAADHSRADHALALRTLGRRHFRTVYELVAPHKTKRPTILDDLLQGAMTEFGPDLIRSDRYGPKLETNDFLVQTGSGTVESSLQVSGVIGMVPPVEIGLIFAEPSIAEKVRQSDRREPGKTTGGVTIGGNQNGF
jgi:hypothetical protein